MLIAYKKVQKEDNISIKTLVSVPKRQFKHAVDRNRFKRLMREAYRLQKQELYTLIEQQDYTLHVSFTAVTNQLPTQEKVMIKMEKILGKLKDQLVCVNT